MFNIIKNDCIMKRVQYFMYIHAISDIKCILILNIIIKSQFIKQACVIVSLIVILQKQI